MSRLKDLLNLSHVPRWCITPVLKPQSVAEHSYRVAMIAGTIARGVNIAGGAHPNLGYESVAWALIHDAPESYSGDIPSPFKKLARERGINLDASILLCPWMDKEMPNPLVACIVKLADSIEALSWISAYGVMERCRFSSERIDDQLRVRIHAEAIKAEDTYKVPFVKVVRQIMGEVAN